jgi:hypothetical protein
LGYRRIHLKQEEGLEPPDDNQYGLLRNENLYECSGATKTHNLEGFERKRYQSQTGDMTDFNKRVRGSGLLAALQT